MKKEDIDFLEVRFVTFIYSIQFNSILSITKENNVIQHAYLNRNLKVEKIAKTRW